MIGSLCVYGFVDICCRKCHNQMAKISTALVAISDVEKIHVFPGQCETDDVVGECLLISSTSIQPQKSANGIVSDACLFTCIIQLHRMYLHSSSTPNDEHRTLMHGHIFVLVIFREYFEWDGCWSGLMTSQNESSYNLMRFFFWLTCEIFTKTSIHGTYFVPFGKQFSTCHFSVKQN